MPKLISKKQYEHLLALSQSGWRSSYPGSNLQTLMSLEKRGLLQCRHDRGSMFSPQNNIRFHITEAGKKYLEEQP
jgi:DNA-binding PadR family transcriptional regulator